MNNTQGILTVCGIRNKNWKDTELGRIELLALDITGINLCKDDLFEIRKFIIKLSKEY